MRVEACGVGLTVLNYMNGNQARRDELLPRIPGGQHPLDERPVPQDALVR